MAQPIPKSGGFFGFFKRGLGTAGGAVKGAAVGTGRLGVRGLGATKRLFVGGTQNYKGPGILLTPNNKKVIIAHLIELHGNKYRALNTAFQSNSRPEYFPKILTSFVKFLNSTSPTPTTRDLTYIQAAVEAALANRILRNNKQRGLNNVQKQKMNETLKSKTAVLVNMNFNNKGKPKPMTNATRGSIINAEKGVRELYTSSGKQTLSGFVSWLNEQNNPNPPNKRPKRNLSHTESAFQQALHNYEIRMNAKKQKQNANNAARLKGIANKQANVIFFKTLRANPAMRKLYSTSGATNRTSFITFLNKNKNKKNSPSNSVNAAFANYTKRQTQTSPT